MANINGLFFIFGCLKGNPISTQEPLRLSVGKLQMITYISQKVAADLEYSFDLYPPFGIHSSQLSDDLFTLSFIGPLEWKGDLLMIPEDIDSEYYAKRLMQKFSETVVKRLGKTVKALRDVDERRLFEYCKIVSLIAKHYRGITRIQRKELSEKCECDPEIINQASRDLGDLIPSIV